MARITLLAALVAASCTFPDVQLRPDGAPVGSVSLTVAFPPPQSATDRASIVVRGSAQSDEAVAAVRVNGVDVETGDSFANWQLEVALEPGANNLAIETVDRAGNRDSSAASLSVRRVGAPLSTPTAMQLDPGSGRLIVVSSSSLVSVDLASGERAVLASADVGTGVDLGTPRDVAVDRDNNRVFVGRSSPVALLAVDLDTGARQELPASGAALGSIQAVDFDAAQQTLWILDFSLRALVSHDLANGQQTIVSQNGDSRGVPLDIPQGMALDLAGGRALVVDEGLDALVAINLSSGARSIVSDAGRGTGDSLDGPLDVVVDGNRALVADIETRTVVAIDLASGNRTPVSSASTGAGPRLREPFSVALSGGNTVLVGDQGLEAVLAVDSATGDRALYSDTAIGSGESLLEPSGIVLDSAGARLLVVDSALAALLAIDLATGARSVVSGSGVGSGVELNAPVSVVLDPGNADRALLSDRGLGALVAVELATGQRAIVSGPSVGQGDAFVSPAGIAALSNSTVLVADSDARGVFTVDLADGDRSLASGDGVGMGTSLARPVSVLDVDGETGIIGDVIPPQPGAPFAGRLMSVIWSSGDRQIVGPGFGEPVSVVLDSARSRVLVLDRSLSSLIAVSTDGSESEVVGNNNSSGAGVRFHRPTAMDWDPLTEAAFVVNGLAIVAVDTRTGQRAVLNGPL